MACSEEATVSSVAAEVMVHLAQAVEIAIENEDLGVHADGHGRGGEAGHPGAQNDDTGGAHAGNPAHQDAPAAAGSHEVVGTHQRGHPAGDLAHGRQQRQRVVLLAHGLVGDGHVAGGNERVGALTGGGEVEVGEEGLVLSRPQ